MSIIFRKYGNLLQNVLLNVIVYFVTIVSVFPIIWIVYSSLKTQKEFALDIIKFPAKPQFINYIRAIEISNMDIYFLNSLVISLTAVIFIILIGYITGYILSRYSFKGRNIIFSLFLLGMLLPVHSLLVPVFVQFKLLNLLDKRISLIITYIAFGLPLTIFLIESFVRSIPLEIEEAACIDGASAVQTMMKIIMPVCTPVLSTAVILGFLNAWNEFPFALILIRRQALKTIPVGLANFTGEFSTNYTQMMAGMVIAILPVIITYLIFSRNIIKGMTAGAVKA